MLYSNELSDHTNASHVVTISCVPLAAKYIMKKIESLVILWRGYSVAKRECSR